MSTVASITVAGLQTPSRWVDGLIVEIYSDAGLTQKVDAQTSGVTWTGSVNVQSDLIMFSGLNFGATYWLRAGVVTPVTNEVTWSSTFSLVASTGSTPTTTYAHLSGLSPNYSAGGVTFLFQPINPPPDVDHYEAYWTYDGFVPVASTEPTWRGTTANGSWFHFSVGLPGNTPGIALYLRAVTTSNKAQAWVTIGGFGTGNLDHVVNGADFAKVRVGALTDGNVDPRLSGVIKLGSVNPSWSGSLNFGVSTAADGTSWVTWTWTTLTIRLVDGTNLTVTANNTGYTVGGLTHSTTYYFYPWVDAFSNPGRIGFVAGGIGTDAVAHTSKDAEWDRSQNLQNHIPLSAGAIVITTPATPSSGTTGGTGSGGGSGGGGTGGGGCPRFGQKVYKQDKHFGKVEVLAETLRCGDYVLGENDQWLQVFAWQHKLEHEFLRITTHRGEVIEHSPCTEMKLDDGTIKKTCDLTMSDLIVTRKGISRIAKIELIEEADWKVVMEIQKPHMFWCGTNAPDILAHNAVIAK